MSSIAARAGGSKGTLYNHFSSKEELFVAVVETKCEEILSFIYQVEVDGGEFESALTQLAEKFLTFALGDEAIATYRLVTAESGRFPELGRALYQRGFQRGIAKLAAYFERAMAAGHLRRRDPARAAEHFFEFCKCGIHHRRLWNVTPVLEADEIRQQAALAVETFLAVYGVR